MTEEISHTNFYYENEDGTFCIVLATSFNKALQSPTENNTAKASLYHEGYGCFFTDEGKYVDTDGKARNGRFQFLDTQTSPDDSTTMIAAATGISLCMKFSENGQTMEYTGTLMHGKHNETDTLKLVKRESLPLKQENRL